MTLTRRSCRKSSSPLPTTVEKTKKKVVKHSKKFVRTQTGCLQCRQKKKKCDGLRPNCVSCTKRGIPCEFPANIRFFHFNNSNENFEPEPVRNHHNKHYATVSGKKELKDVTDQELNLKQIEIEKHNEEVPQLIRKNQVKVLDDSLQRVEIRTGIEKTELQSCRTEKTPLLSSRSSSMCSNAPSLISDHSDSELDINQQPQSVLDFKPKVRPNQSMSRIDSAETALNLANDGKSIHDILNNITIDLIKQSISNLKYINLDSKIKVPQSSSFTSPGLQDYEIGQVLKDSLQFDAEGLTNNLNINNFGISFKPDDFLALEGL